MAKKTKQAPQKKRSRKTRIFTVVTIVACLSFVTSIISSQIEIVKEKQILDELNSQIEVAQLENNELERLSQDGKQDEYLERVAREKLGYADPNEQVFVDLPGSN